MASNIKSVVILIAVGSIAWLAAGAVATVMDADAKMPKSKSGNLVKIFLQFPILQIQVIIIRDLLQIIFII
jgi:hypothetical protein